MKKVVVFLLISTSTGANLRVPYEAFGYAHADSSTSTTNPSSLSSSVPADSIDGMNAMAPSSMSSTPNPSANPPALEHSMENIYDQSPRFKATATTTVASGAGSFGYNTYLHTHHHLPADQVANQQNMAQALKNPLLYARDGGAYDAWKAAQTQQHADVGASEATSELSRGAALERFQRSQVTLTKVNEEPETPEESEPEGDASGGATAPAEDELITAAEERVAKAQTNADALHTDVVGTALAIKDTLKETSSSVGDAHEEVSDGGVVGCQALCVCGLCVVHVCGSCLWYSLFKLFAFFFCSCCMASGSIGRRRLGTFRKSRIECATSATFARCPKTKKSSGRQCQRRRDQSPRSFGRVDGATKSGQ